VLDVGCGPGTISLSFAPFVGPTGKIIGVDASSTVIEQAREKAKEQGLDNLVEFRVGNAIERLEEFQDGSFDVVHAHQVVQHVSEPLKLLAEMKRLVKPDGGIVSFREGDMGNPTIYPYTKLINDDWLRVYRDAQRANGGDPECGRKLHALLRQAGFAPKDIIMHKPGAMSYGGGGPDAQKERDNCGNLWAERVGNPESGLHQTALKNGYATEELLKEIAEAWKSWSRNEDAWMLCLNTEIIVRTGTR
jgi:SAM-dependent methyltransferase